MTNVLLILAIISLIIAAILATPTSDCNANILSPLAGSLLGLIFLLAIFVIPIMSFSLGPSLVIAQIISTLLGTQLTVFAIIGQFELPTLFAVKKQVGCNIARIDFALGKGGLSIIENRILGQVYLTFGL